MLWHSFAQVRRSYRMRHDRRTCAKLCHGNGGELEQIIATIEMQDIEVHGRDALKTVPRGYPADHPRGELLRYKGIVAWKEWPPEPWLETAEAKDRIAGFLRAARPLSEWLDAHVGPSTQAGP